MNNLFKNTPEVKDKTLVSSIMLSFFTVISAVTLMLPAVAYIKSSFTRVDGSVPHTLLKCLFAVSLVICISIFVVNKDIYALCIPCIIGAVMLIFPLVNSITGFISAKGRADAFGMTISYEPYVISICEYTLFFLLSVFSFLYILGFFKLPIIMLMMSVAASILSIYTVINNFFMLLMPLYDVVCFVPGVTAPLIPVFLITSTKTMHSSREKYQPKRMKK